MREAIDHNAWNSVRHELDKILQQARLSLEDYEVNPDAPELLEECAAQLHQLRGPMQMLELQGAVLLARELEQVIDALLQDLVEQPVPALELIMQSLLQLPGYLAGLQSGHKENPAVLMPLVNSLRAVRSAQPLEESAVFSPDISVPVPTHVFSAQSAAGKENTRDTARAVRRQFQAGLLEWFRSGAESSGFEVLSEVLEHLLANAAREPMARLWWISAGVVEALSTSVIDDSPEIKRLFGHIDRQIKYMADNGEAAAAGQIPAELFRGLLYQIARAGSHDGRIEMIRQTYHLDDCLLPGADSDALAYPDSYRDELLQTVADSLRTGTICIRDYLDDISNHVHCDSAVVESVANDLHMQGNALNMIGMNALGSRLAEQECLLSAAAGAESGHAGSAADDIGSAFGVMEDVLAVICADLEGSGMPNDSIREQEHGEVIRDISELMMLAKSVLNDCVNSPDNIYLLDPVPGFLSQVQIGLHTIGQQHAADVLTQIEEFITHVLMIRRSALMSDELDDLADAISCIDSFIEDLGDNRTPGDMMLEIAEKSMRRRGYHKHAEVNDYAGKSSAAVVGNDIGNTGTEPGSGGLSGREETQEDPQDEYHVQTVDLPESDTADIDAAEDEFPVLSDGADPEIVEIYLEEAAEELEILSKVLPGWLDNPADRDALDSMRRSFHTLKGSGRMAGAMRAGEFSWSIESLLNRVLEGSVAADEGVCELLGQVLEPLAQLMGQIGGGPAPDVDIQWLMARAAELGSGNSSGPADEMPGDDADTELTDIFIAECHEQLQSIFDYLAADLAGSVVTEPVFRALHTITGISETAGATSVNKLVSGLYSYFDGLYQLQIPVNTDAFDILRECAGAIEGMLVNIPAGETDPAWLPGLCARIASLAANDERQPVIMGSAAETGTDAGQDIPVLTQVAEVEEVADVAEVAEFEEVEEVAVVAEVMQEPEAPDACAEMGATAGRDGNSHSENEGEGDPYDDMDPELVEIFIEEASEIIDSSEDTLRRWAADPGNSSHLDELQRQLHTLKGGARMVNIGAIGDLSHALESLLTEVAEDRISPSQSLFSLLVNVQDGLVGMLEQVKQRKLPTASSELQAAMSRFQHADEAEPAAVGAIATESLPESAPAIEGGPDAESGVESVPDPEVEPKVEAEPEVEQMVEAGPDPEPGSVANVETGADAGQAAVKVPAGESAIAAHNAAMTEKSKQEGSAVQYKAEQRKTPRGRGEQIRVPASLLDDMVNLAGEITIYRSRIDQQVSDYRFNLNELEQTIARLHEQLRLMEIETEAQILFRFEQEEDSRNKEFDLLEMDRYSNLQQLSRSMIESIGDLMSINELMDGSVRESEVLLQQQSRVNTKLQDGLIRTRMIPFNELAPRLRRVLRQAAQALGKNADLGLEGAEGEIDRTVVERIIAPLEHMLRNAVAHGIETPEQRRQAGKVDTGTVTISMQREGSEIVMRIADDGAGVDLDAIRARAVERGLLAQEADLPDNDIMQFILQTGFSTAGEITQISGRGVGMDIVNSEVKQLGGSLQIESTRGIGTAVTMRLPYTLAINQALLVKAGEQIFCIPLGSIEGVVNIESSELLACYEAGGGFDYAGNNYRLEHLGTMLGTGGMETGKVRGNYPVLIARVGNKRMAIQVDALMGSREIVIKPLGVQLSTVDGISGATILGDGRVVLILDLAAVALVNTRTQSQESRELVQTTGKLVVMVVDDSITVRKVTTRLLERKGFKVYSAKDGVEAIGQLQETVPDILLLDVEMPRMDGFELATHIRNDRRLHKLPIIMITSRTGDKHRERARRIGVNHYLGKPYQENELLDSISTLMGNSAGTHVT